MNYTQSDAYAVHVATGHRMHQDVAPVTTLWTSQDANMLIWSLMEVLNAAGIAPATFNKDDPNTYNRLRQAIQAIATAGSGVQGTFTPALSFGGASTGITYAIAQGNVVTLGKLVHYWAFLQLTSKGSASGPAKVTLATLPNATANFPGTVSIDQMSGFAQHPSSMLVSGTNLLELRTFDGSGSESALATNANFSNTTQLYLWGSYLKP